MYYILCILKKMFLQIVLIIKVKIIISKVGLLLYLNSLDISNININNVIINVQNNL